MYVLLKRLLVSPQADLLFGVDDIISGRIGENIANIALNVISSYSGN